MASTTPDTEFAIASAFSPFVSSSARTNLLSFLMMTLTTHYQY